MAQPPVVVKFHIATLERKASKETMRAARQVAKLVRDRIRAFAPEDSGALVKALAIYVRNRKTGVTAYVGINKNIRSFGGEVVRAGKKTESPVGIPVVDYAKRKELGFYGKDKLGRFVQHERTGLRFFQRGLETSRYRVRKVFGGMGL